MDGSLRSHRVDVFDEQGCVTVDAVVAASHLTHPDKGTEMFLYELAVNDRFRRRGIGSALVAALVDLARARGCYGMWVLTDADDSAALATYQSSGPTQQSESVMLTWRLHGTHHTSVD